MFPPVGALAPAPASITAGGHRRRTPDPEENVLTVRDLMTRDLITVTPTTTLREAAEAMAADHVSGLPVVEAGEAVGVVSATDVLSFAADAPGVEIDRSRAGGVDQIPEGGQWEEGAEPPAYYTDEWEGGAHPIGEKLPDTDRPEWNVLEESHVAEIMTRSLHTVSPGDSVREAARAMLDVRVHRLLVVEDERLIGVISTTDVMEAVAENGIAE